MRLFTVALWLLASAAADPTATQLTESLQRKYDTVKDLSADFVQTYTGGVLRKQITERGQVWIKKPGKMRWNYLSPEKKEFVSDGVRVYAYTPQDNQVIVAPAPDADQGFVLFLAGKGNLTRDFTASLAELPMGFPPSARAIKLVPKSPQPDYDAVIAVVDAHSSALLGIVTFDTQGGRSAISFANLKENLGTADKVFVFKIPRGAEVITDATR